MLWSGALPNGNQGHSAAQYRWWLYSRQCRYRPCHCWGGAAWQPGKTSGNIPHHRALLPWPPAPAFVRQGHDNPARLADCWTSPDKLQLQPRHLLRVCDIERLSNLFINVTICADFLGAVGAAAPIEMGSVAATHPMNWPNYGLILINSLVCFLVTENNCTVTWHYVL